MGKKMNKLSQEIENDEELKTAFINTLLGSPSNSHAIMALFPNLEDPDINEEVRALLNNVLNGNMPVTSNPDEVDVEYYDRMRSKFLQACKKAGIDLKDR